MACVIRSTMMRLLSFFVLATFCQAQTEVQVGAWFTSLDLSSDTNTVRSQLQQTSTTSQWTFPALPESTSAADQTSGLQTSVDVDGTTNTIRIELTTLPTSSTGFTERIYIFFEGIVFEDVQLLTPGSLPTDVNVQVLPPNSEIEFLDPTFPDFGSIFPVFDDGTLEVEFVNAQSSTAGNFPTVLEFNYRLAGDPPFTTPPGTLCWLFCLSLCSNAKTR